MAGGMMAQPASCTWSAATVGISWSAVPTHRRSASASSSSAGLHTCAKNVTKLGKVVARRLAVRFHNLPV